MEPAKRRRILFLLTTSDWGGVQHFVFAMAKACQRLDLSVMVAAGGDGELGARCTERGIAYAKLETVRRDLSLVHDLAAIHEIRTLLRGYRPDVVHLNSSKMGVIGSIAADLEHVPRVVYRIGGWAFLERIGVFKRFLYLLAERWTAPKKDVIVTVHPGDEAVAERKRIRPRHRLVTIPNGIDLAAFDRDLLSRDEARKRLGLPLDATIVGTVANFYPPKNLPWYLEAVSTMRQPLFVIVGDGPERDAIETKHQELGLADSVILAGRREDVQTLYRAFDMFVLPSSKEGMPWSLLEAMAAGVPCVATDVGACGWMLDDEAGIVVPSGDADALTNALSTLLGDTALRTRLGDAARNAVERRFRWETSEKATLDLLT
ncbi:glycosyltransferase family 4 protein [Patescibacteria group bacterium]|nr:glycosyltransferase family 4 protein [Patescibacteria group bacterium]